MPMSSKEMAESLKNNASNKIKKDVIKAKRTYKKKKLMKKIWQLKK